MSEVIEELRKIRKLLEVMAESERHSDGRYSVEPRSVEVLSRPEDQKTGSFDR